MVQWPQSNLKPTVYEKRIEDLKATLDVFIVVVLVDFVCKVTF